LSVEKNLHETEENRGKQAPVSATIRVGSNISSSVRILRSRIQAVSKQRRIGNFKSRFKIYVEKVGKP
jgi:hypothetical protein